MPDISPSKIQVSLAGEVPPISGKISITATAATALTIFL